MRFAGSAVEFGSSLASAGGAVIIQVLLVL
jgi:hypothetical protein